MLLVLAACSLILLSGCDKPSSVKVGPNSYVIYNYDLKNVAVSTVATAIPKLSEKQKVWLKAYNDQQKQKMAARAIAPVAQKRVPLVAPLASLDDIAYVAKRVAELNGSFKKAKNGAITSVKIMASADGSFTIEDMKKIGKLYDLTAISLEGAIFDDEYLAQIKDLKKLESVTINNSEIQDPTLEMLAKLPELKTLDLRRDLKLKNDSLEIIPKMPKLENLYIYYNTFTTSGIKKLIKPVMAPALKIVDVRGCPDISNLGAKHLSKIPTLEEVYFRGIIDNSGVEKLTAAPKLRFIEFQDCNDINSESVEFFKKMSALKGLRFFRCKGLDDTTIQGLSSIPFTRLELRDLNLSNQALEALKGNKTIRELELSELPGVTAEGLSGFLGTLGEMDAIHFFTIPLDDKGIALIAEKMPNLKQLTARAVAISGNGIDAVLKLNKLQELDLRDNEGLAPDALLKLGQMKDLKRLYLNGTKLGLPENAAAMEQLRKALPKCAISN